MTTPVSYSARMTRREEQRTNSRRDRPVRTLGFAWLIASATTGCQIILGIDTSVAIEGGTARADADAAEHGDGDAPACTSNFDAHDNVYYRHFDWRNADAGASVEYDQDAMLNPDASPGLTGEIKVTLTEKGGAWKALVPLDAGLLDTCPFGRLIFELVPTKSDQSWACYLVGADGGAVQAPVTWTTGTTDGPPLSASIPRPMLNDTGAPVSGLVIQNTSGNVGDVWYLNLVGFANGSQDHL